MNIKTPIQRFRKLIQANRIEIGRVYVYAIFQGMVNLSIPLGIQAIVNLIQGGQISTSWIVLVIVVVLGILLTGVLQLVQMRIIENIQQKIFANAAFDFTYRTPKIKASELEKNSAPELMNRFFDTISVQKGLSKVLIDFSTATLQVVFGLILLGFYHSFFILFGVGLFALVLAIFKYTSIRGLETSLNESKYKYKVVAWLEELARTRFSFKITAHNDYHLKQTDKNVSHYLGYREGHFKVLRQQYILLIIFKALVAAGLLLIGGLLVLNQQMNIGQFIAAEIIILLVINSVEKLILSIENVYDVVTSLEKIGYVTDLKIDEDEAGTQQLSNGGPIAVEIDQVSFNYSNSDEKVLDNVSISIKAGQHTCLTGQSGTGKTTLLYMLAGVNVPTSGIVRLNNLPFGNYNREDLYRHIGIRFNQEFIFTGTIFDNITLGREELKKEDVEWASEFTLLNKFVLQLPLGYDTRIGSEGLRLPKSVIQKLLMTRSIVHKPNLLLMENGMEFIEEKERKTIMNHLTQPNMPWTIVTTSVFDEVKNSCIQKIEL